MAARIKRKTRRKKRHYKTGIHKSSKCAASFKYRSGWELAVAIFLDEDPNVVEYSYEPIKIPYKSNKSRAKLRNYSPDFLVTYKDGHKILVEVKRQDQMNNLVVIKKAEAGKAWAALQENTTYEMWCDDLILPLLRKQKINDKKNKT